MVNIQVPTLSHDRLAQKIPPYIWLSICDVKTNVWRDERRHKNEALGTKLWSCQGWKKVQIIREKNFFFRQVFFSSFPATKNEARTLKKTERRIEGERRWYFWPFFTT